MSNRFETQFHHLTNTDEKGTISFRISITWPSIQNHRLQRKFKGKDSFKVCEAKNEFIYENLQLLFQAH
jgi:hypothetical protein